MLHQGMSSRIDFFLKYELNGDSFTVENVTLMRDVARVLMSYPADYGHWEIVNLSITHTQKLLERYSQLKYISLKLTMLPRTRIPCPNC